MILSRYKRRCDRCGKEIDINYMVTLQKGKKHCCIICAGTLLRTLLKGKELRDTSPLGE